MAVQEAIVVRGARKRYNNDSPILNGLNLTVSWGSIYGLLGASGCGKTTLLSCIVGVRRLNAGDIWVLGGRPGSKGSGIPGPRVGYMPQEISLVKEFTVIGALYYFGRINGLEDDVIEERYPFLSNLLQLPPKNQLVRDMSGGQRRRVSFAASLIHKPELLILDEPTVGLDPVLRENIWNFLTKIAQEEGTTVVITTHYIEEAKLANRIGLMRCGKLLAEESPNQLLMRFQCQSLEEVFLILSRRQAEIQDEESVEMSPESLPELEEITAPVNSLYNNNYSGIENGTFKDDKRSMKKNEKSSRSWRWTVRKFKALMTKNILQFLRHPGGILFALVFPVIQVVLFFNAIGQDPKNLMIAVVNEEADNCDYGRISGNVIYDADNETCDFVDLSCRFLRDFNDSIARKKFYPNLMEAKKALRKGKVAGAMYFDRNFSKALQTRRDYQRTVTNKEIFESEIQMLIDTGNRQIGLHLQKELYERFFEIFEDIMRECRILPKFADLPIKFEEPIFGKKNQKYTSFMAPAFLLTATFFLATSVSSSIIIADRYEGVWDRSLVQGVSTAEILLSHLLTQLGVIIIQVTMSLCISFLHFNLECRGSMIVVISLMLLVGFCGMCYGFLISVVCTNHTMANYVSTGSFYPVILLCGFIWPIEGMPKILRWFSLSLPTTVPSIAMRGLLDKGYPIEEPQVYNGFLVALGWTVGFIILCLIGLRSKTSL